MANEELNEIVSIVGDLGEVGLDSILEDGIFKDIPFLGVGISIAKLIASASDKILLKKLILFIRELNLKNQTEVDEFKDKYFKIEDYKIIGSKLLLILDRSDSEIKIRWLAKILQLLVGKELSLKDFLRLSSIINNCYVGDMQEIGVFLKQQEITSTNQLIEQYILDHLFSIGVLESRGFDGGDFSGNSGTVYALNRFGEIFMNKIL